MPRYSSACDCGGGNGNKTELELSLVLGLRPHYPPAMSWGLHALGMFVEGA